MKRIALCLIVFCLCWAGVSPVLQGEEITQQEMELWNQVKNTSDIRELQIYIETYPQGHFSAQAVKRKWVLTLSTADIVVIEAYIKANPHSPFLNDAVEAIWKLVDRSGDVSLYETFILKYPSSPFVRVAEARLKRMTEKRIWEKAKAANSIDALKVYLADHPQSRYVADAQALLWSMVRNSGRIEVLEDFTRSFPDSWLVSKAEELQWQLVRDSRDETIIRRYLEEHPESRFRGLARLNLLRLQKRAQDIETSELTVTDHQTRLLWQKTVDTTTNWEQAAAYCGDLSLADFDDWRLPTIEELKTLDSIQQYFPKPPFENHWSATAYDKDSAGAWMISTQSQVVNVDYKRNTHSIRCVRDLPSPPPVDAPAAEINEESP